MLHSDSHSHHLLCLKSQSITHAHVQCGSYIAECGKSKLRLSYNTLTVQIKFVCSVEHDWEGQASTQMFAPLFFLEPHYALPATACLLCQKNMCACPYSFPPIEAARGRSQDLGTRPVLRFLGCLSTVFFYLRACAVTPTEL